MKNLIRVLFCFLVLSSANQSAQAWQEPEGICLARKCGWNLLQCGVNQECRNWLSCIQDCGEDNIKCPSFCGFYHQSERINQTNLCIFESDCVDLGFDQYEDYTYQGSGLEQVSGIAGDYWFAASHGGNHIFDYDCQKFAIEPQSDSLLTVDFSVPLTKGEETKITSAKGVFEQFEDGRIEVRYENFVGYHEEWYLLGKSEHAFLVHVCFTKGEECHDYGTLLLSQKPFEEFDSEEQLYYTALTEREMGVSFFDFNASGITGCVNQ